MNEPLTHGKWTKEAVWIYRNDRGDIMRAQDMHPSEEVKAAEKILKVSREKGGVNDG